MVYRFLIYSQQWTMRSLILSKGRICGWGETVSINIFRHCGEERTPLSIVDSVFTMLENIQHLLKASTPSFENKSDACEAMSCTFTKVCEPISCTIKKVCALWAGGGEDNKSKSSLHFDLLLKLISFNTHFYLRLYFSLKTIQTYCLLLFFVII